MEGKKKKTTPQKTHHQNRKPDSKTTKCHKTPSLLCWKQDCYQRFLCSSPGMCCPGHRVATLSHDCRYPLCSTQLSWGRDQSHRQHIFDQAGQTHIHRLMAHRIKVRVVLSGALGNTTDLESSTYFYFKPEILFKNNSMPRVTTEYVIRDQLTRIQGIT